MHSRLGAKFQTALCGWRRPEVLPKRECTLCSFGRGGDNVVSLCAKTASLLGILKPLIFLLPQNPNAPLVDTMIWGAFRGVIKSFDEITLALVGIGTAAPSPLIASSGNIFSDDELETLRQNGAVVDVLYRFFDAEEQPVQTSLADRVTGMEITRNCGGPNASSGLPVGRAHSTRSVAR